MSPFGAGVAASAVNLGFGLVNNTVTGLVNNAFYRRNLNLQVGAQKDLIDYQNEYNSPSAQMQRLQAAGLNPNLVYGSAAPAGVSGNAAAPSGGAVSGSYGSFDVAAAGEHIARMRAESSVEQLNVANARLANATAEEKEIHNARYPEIVENIINEGKERIKNISEDTNLKIAQTNKTQADQLLTEAETAYRMGEIDLQQYRKQEIIATCVLLSEQSKTERTKQDLNRAQSETERARQGLIRQQTETEGWRTKEAHWSALLTEIEANWERTVKNQGNAALAREQFAAYLKTEANRQGIKGKSAVLWINELLNWFSGTSSSAANVGRTYKSFK